MAAPQTHTALARKWLYLLLGQDNHYRCVKKIQRPLGTWEKQCAALIAIHTHTHFEEGKTVNKAGKHDSDNKHTTFIQIYIYTLSGSRALKTESTPLITHNMDLKHFINWKQFELITRLVKKSKHNRPSTKSKPLNVIGHREPESNWAARTKRFFVQSSVECITWIHLVFAINEVITE